MRATRGCRDAHSTDSPERKNEAPISCEFVTSFVAVRGTAPCGCAVRVGTSRPVSGIVVQGRFVRDSRGFVALVGDPASPVRDPERFAMSCSRCSRCSYRQSAGASPSWRSRKWGQRGNRRSRRGPRCSGRPRQPLDFIMRGVVRHPGRTRCRAGGGSPGHEFAGRADSEIVGVKFTNGNEVGLRSTARRFRWSDTPPELRWCRRLPGDVRPDHHPRLLLIPNITHHQGNRFSTDPIRSGTGDPTGRHSIRCPLPNFMGGGESPCEPRGAYSSRGSGQTRAGEQGIETVESAGPDVQFGVAAGCPDPGGVIDDLVAEDFGGTDVDVGGREAGKFASSTGRDVGGDLLIGKVGHERVPGELVGLTSPAPGSARVLTAGSCGVAVDKHRAT